MIRLSRYPLLMLLVTAHIIADAQFNIYGQLRTRAELRDGQGSPLPKNVDPAFFISQRTRLNVEYNTYRLKFGVSVQDVRVWGQDVSTINRTTVQNNNGLMLHEAWAQLGLTDTTNKKVNLTLKLGRQELIFDDQRLIGNLDWLQQARHHDAALLKYIRSHWTLNAGVAYNQNKESSSGTIYNPVSPGNYSTNTNGGSIYKSFQFVHINRRLKSGSVSVLAFADQFNRYLLDSVKTKVWTRGAWTRFTTGLYFTNAFNKLTITGAAYYQGGKTSDNQHLSALLLSGSVMYQFRPYASAGFGYDYTSGGSSGSRSHSFDPLYGTPHKFWGLMDYFYAASGFGKGGLTDYYLKTKFRFSDKYNLAADLHQFYSASNINTPAGLKGSRSSLCRGVGGYSPTRRDSPPRRDPASG